jgi:hypothetical protein
MCDVISRAGGATPREESDQMQTIDEHLPRLVWLARTDQVVKRRRDWSRRTRTASDGVHA